jgi:hypothetical protein
MDEEAMLVFVLFFAMPFLGIMWFRASWLRRRAERRLWSVVTQYELPAELLKHDLDVLPFASASSPRMEQLEGQVDQIAQQLERLTESQDFLARLMAQHDPARRLPEPRVNTPH